MLKIDKGFCKVANALIVQMRIEKTGLRKFLHSQKGLVFDTSECLCRQGVQSTKHLLVECSVYTGKRNQIEEGDKNRAKFGKIS